MPAKTVTLQVSVLFDAIEVRKKSIPVINYGITEKWVLDPNLFDCKAVFSIVAWPT